MSAVAASRSGRIAIVGIACRFPGARNVREFWENLLAGKDCISRFTEDEREQPGMAAGGSAQVKRVLANGVVDDIDQFDARLFGFSDQEAAITDPQQRLGLETAWSCMIDAGLQPQSTSGSIGVFTSASTSTYLINELLPRPEQCMAAGGMPLLIRNDKDHAATLIAYKLGLTGPALNVGCGCSGGLAAVHLATQSLRTWQCDVAICGASSLLIPQRQGHLAMPNGIYSHDGYCRVFDASASGTIGSGGVGFVALKRFEDAVRDGDRIYATILGSAMNNDGKLKVGYTAPSLRQQAEAIVLAHQVSDVSPDSISMIEAHGTGTIMGDPIEVQALTSAFSRGTSQKNFCALGSVKSNIGHTDVAAGIAGLIKTALSLHHAVIPPTLHCANPSPELRLEDSPFFVNTEARPWQARHGVRRAGVNSLGMGGTNVHVVMQEHVEPVPAPAWKADCYVYPISAHRVEVRETWERSLRLSLERHEQQRQPDAAGCLAYTLATRRPVLKARSAFVATDRSALTAALTEAGTASSQRAAKFVLVLGEMKPGLTLPQSLLMHGCEAEAATLRVLVQDAVRPVPESELQLLACGAWARGLGLRFDAVVGLGVGAHAALVGVGALSVAAATDLLRGPQAGGKWSARLASEGHEPEHCPMLLSEGAPTLESSRAFWRSVRQQWQVQDEYAVHVLDPCGVFESDSDFRERTGIDAHSNLVGPRCAGSRALLSAIAASWCSGADIDWRRLYGYSPWRWIELPEYPLERKRYWIGGARRGPDEVVKDLDKRLQEQYARLSERSHVVPLASYPGLESGLDDLCRSFIARFVGPSELPAEDAKQLSSRLEVHARHRPFFEALVRRCRERSTPVGESADIAAELRIRYPAFVPLIDILCSLGKELPAHMRDSLSGAFAFNQLLNDGSLRRALLTEPAFSNVEACCRVAASCIEELAAARQQPLRVLEVGAGRLIFTQYMEEAIRAGTMEYWITDVSPSIVQDAEKAAEARGLNVHTAVLDITRPLSTQLPAATVFDIVAALNVVHVCPQIDKALANLRDGLAADGRLLIMEAISDPLWASFLWGWSEGWWNFDDGKRRSSPLLDRQGWQRAIDSLQPAASLTFAGCSGDPLQGDTCLWIAHFDQAAANPVTAIQQRQRDPEQWLYRSCYVRQAVGRQRTQVPHDAWIVFADTETDSMPYAALIERLREESRVIMVYPGTGYKRIGANSHGVQPTSQADLREFLVAVRDALPASIGILFAWSAMRPSVSDTREAASARQQHPRFYSLMALAQSLAEEYAGRCSINVLTRGLYGVTGSEALEPAESLVAAAAKIVPREYWQYSCRVIDLDDAAMSDARTWTLAADLMADADAPAFVAVRNASCWIPTHVPLGMAHSQRVPQRLRRNGTYVIFGGLGGVGYSIARFLARCYSARLLLVGRSADASDEKTAAMILQLRDLGGDAAVFAADISVREDVEAALAEAESSFGGIHGVIHSAGEIDDGGVIHNRSFERTAAKIAAKVQGTTLLIQALESRSIDFLVLFSSIGSTLYKLKFGEVGYVAGNDYLVAAAQALAPQAPYFVQVIQWTDWDGGSGMWSRARSALRDSYSAEADEGRVLSTDLLQALRSEEGVATFEKALQTDESHLLVCVQPLEDLLRRHDQYRSADYGQFLDRVGLTRRSAAVPPVVSSARSALRGMSLLRSIWEEVVGSQVEDDSDFFDIGGDSLLALRVISRVAEEFKVTLPLNAFFSSSTLREMFAYVENLQWAGAEQDST